CVRGLWVFFFSSRRRHTRLVSDWSSDVCSSDLSSPAARVTPDSPALQVMTDLARVSPATIRPQAPLAGANQFMITRGVRLLLVVDERENVVGVITATDLLGERPMLVATERGLRRDELIVSDIMTPAERVDVIALADV